VLLLGWAGLGWAAVACCFWCAGGVVLVLVLLGWAAASGVLVVWCWWWQWYVCYVLCAVCYVLCVAGAGAAGAGLLLLLLLIMLVVTLVLVVLSRVNNITIRLDRLYPVCLVWLFRWGLRPPSKNTAASILHGPRSIRLP